MLELRRKCTNNDIDTIEPRIATYNPITKQVEIYNVILKRTLQNEGIAISGTQAKFYGRVWVHYNDKIFGEVFKDVYVPIVFPKHKYEWVEIIDKI